MDSAKWVISALIAVASGGILLLDLPELLRFPALDSVEDWITMGLRILIFSGAIVAVLIVRRHRKGMHRHD